LPVPGFSLAVTEPFVNIRIFSAWKFSAVLFALFIINAVFMGIFYLLPFYLVREMGADLATSGLYLLVPPLVIALVSIPFGRLSDQHGRRAFTVAACIGIVLASAVFALISADSGIVPLLAGLVILGLAYGIAAGPFGGRVIECAPEGEIGTGSSLMVTAIYFGGVIGTAVYAAFFTFVTSGTGGIVAFADLAPAAFLHGFHATMATGGVIAVTAVILSAIVPDRQRDA
jgi:MFS family permease